MSWEPLTDWEAEQPQRCTLCGDVWVGRELGYMPNFCEQEGCPGPPERIQVIVAPVEPPL